MDGAGEGAEILTSWSVSLSAHRRPQSLSPHRHTSSNKATTPISDTPIGDCFLSNHRVETDMDLTTFEVLQRRLCFEKILFL